MTHDSDPSTQSQIPAGFSARKALPFLWRPFAACLDAAGASWFHCSFLGCKASSYRSNLGTCHTHGSKGVPQTQAQNQPQPSHKHLMGSLVNTGQKSTTWGKYISVSWLFSHCRAPIKAVFKEHVFCSPQKRQLQATAVGRGCRQPGVGASSAAGPDSARGWARSLWQRCNRASSLEKPVDH